MRVLSWIVLYVGLGAFAQESTREFPHGVDPTSFFVDPAQFLPLEPPLERRHRPARRQYYLGPRIFIISQFDAEANIWYRYVPEIKQRRIHVPGFSPLFPYAYCNNAGTICQMTVGEGQSNAAASIAALLYQGIFRLSQTYFLISGIGGINPEKGTTGTVCFSRYSVQLDLTFEVDARQKPDYWDHGFVPLGNDKPTFYDPSIPPSDPRSAYPRAIYGTEVYELNANLRERWRKLVVGSKLNDTAEAQLFRSKYPTSPARDPPKVIACDTQSSNVFWGGSILESIFNAYTQLLTNGSSSSGITQQEDNATLEALLRGHIAGKIDFARVGVLRTASDIDRAPPGQNEGEALVRFAEQGGFIPALENIGITGSKIVRDVVDNWESYKGGVAKGNQIGSLLVRF